MVVSNYFIKYQKNNLMNPLLAKKHLPDFQSIKTSHIEPALNNTITEHAKTLKKLLSSKSKYNWQNLMMPLIEANEKLTYVWGLISHLNMVVNKPSLRKIYNKCLPKITAYYISLGQNRELYEAVFSITKNKGYPKLDFAQKKILENMLRDFRLAGIDLPETKRKQYSVLQEKLSKLQSKFSENVLDATNAWSKLITDQKTLKGLPEYIINAALQNAKQIKKEGWLLTLHAPFYQAVLTYADHAALRKEIYLAYVARASSHGKHSKKLDNSKLINEILKLRYQLSGLLGFQNYAELSLATKMVENPAQVTDFLYDLAKKSKKKATSELKTLEKFVFKNYKIKHLQPWDLAYYSEKMRKAQYDISEEEVRKYFPLDQVLEGMWKFLQRLYSISITEVNKASIWHKDARCFAIYDIKKQLLGHFYLDLYARSGKQGGAWMDSCRTRNQSLKGKTTTPIAYVICNFSPPIAKQPTLLTFYEVNTIFHEFGHALQYLLTEINYAPVAGINGVPWDAVEIASQFMERWCLEKEVLEMISCHYETKEKLPAELLQKMLLAKNMQSGLQMLRQVEFSLIDFLWHMNDLVWQNNNVQKILDTVRAKVNIVPISKYNFFQNSFSHVFCGGYAAGYYSYKWAEVAASDIFSKFKEDGIFNKKVVRSFVKNILASGGAVDPLKAFEKFRGRKPSVEALLKDSGI